MKIFWFVFVAVLFFGFAGNVLAFQEFQASCSMGEFLMLTNQDYEATSMSCDYVSGNDIDKTQIYIFYAIMLIAFFLFILMLIVIPK